MAALLCFRGFAPEVFGRFLQAGQTLGDAKSEAKGRMLKPMRAKKDSANSSELWGGRMLKPKGEKADNKKMQKKKAQAKKAKAKKPVEKADNKKMQKKKAPAKKATAKKT